jgi:hypothetical protein
MLEDYRAGLTVDVEHDREDLAKGRKLQCPLLVLWSERDDLPDLYGDVVAVWKRWADDVRGASIPDTIWRRKPLGRSLMLSMSFSAPLGSRKSGYNYPRNCRAISRRNLGSSSKA